MTVRSGMGATVGVALAICSFQQAARAGDFFSSLFGMFGSRPHGPPISLPFASEIDPVDTPRARASYRRGPAWCVRTCDGRHFPVAGSDDQSRQATCTSLCPAGNTEVVYGNDIDHAAASSGKPYSQLPNAFRYRTESVAGCTCNGRDQAGLASVAIENDPTLRKGDIVAGASGLVIANPAGGRHAELNFAPLPEAVRARFLHVPVVARQ
jgi:Protein of unknown function (DUF2865)